MAKNRSANVPSADGSRTSRPQREATWPLVLLGLAAYPLSPLLATWPSLEMSLSNYGGAPNFAIALTLLSAISARRTAWRATAVTATLAVLASLLLMPRAFQAVSMPGAEIMVSSRLAAPFAQAEAKRLANRRADLAYLERGERAASQGRPFRAPEGGYLVPKETTDLREYDSPWRLASAPQEDTGQAWAEAVRKGREAVREAERSQMRPSVRPDVWLQAGPFVATRTFALALVANLLALASRRLFGAPK